MADLTYTQDSIWTRFIPATDQGEIPFREMMDENGVAAVLNIHAKTVIAQIRNAGYTVKKAKPATQKEINDILDELEVMS